MQISILASITICMNGIFDLWAKNIFITMKVSRAIGPVFVRSEFPYNMLYSVIQSTMCILIFIFGRFFSINFHVQSAPHYFVHCICPGSNGPYQRWTPDYSFRFYSKINICFVLVFFISLWKSLLETVQSKNFSVLNSEFIEQERACTFTFSVYIIP